MPCGAAREAGKRGGEPAEAAVQRARPQHQRVPTMWQHYMSFDANGICHFMHLHAMPKPFGSLCRHHALKQD